MSDRTAEFGRIPVTIAEIDLDFCSRTHSTAPCTAARSDGSECYNTFETCQDVSNYSATVRTYRFAMVDGPEIRGLSAWRSLRSVRMSPGRIDLDGGLGSRDRATLSFADFEHGDEGVDPYRRNRASTPGSFWKKLDARNPNAVGRPVRILSGFLEDDGRVDLSQFVTRRYVLDSLEFGRNGEVTLVAKDALRLLGSDEDQRQRIPEASRGELAADLSAVATSFDLKAYGSDYGTAPIIVSIDDEIIRVGARTGETFSSLTRAYAGTTAAVHSSDSRVQIVRAWENVRIDEIWEDIQTDVGIDPSLIDSAGASAEADVWLSTFFLDAYIREPTAPARLMADLLAFANAVTWWDPEAQETKFRSVRPLSTTESFALSATDAVVVDNSIASRKLEDRRLTRCAIFYAVGDWSRDISKQDKDEPAFSRISRYVDLNAEDPKAFGDIRSKSLFGYFAPATLSAELAAIAFRIVSRRRIAPRSIRFDVETREGRSLRLGDRIRVLTTDVLGIDGNPLELDCILVQKDYPATSDSDRFAIEVESLGIEIARWMFWAPDTAGVYPSDPEYGHWANATPAMPDGSEPYLWI